MTSRQQCEFCERTLWMDRLGTCDECHAAGVNGDTPKALVDQDNGGLWDSYQAGVHIGNQAAWGPEVKTYDATAPEGVDAGDYAEGYRDGFETWVRIRNERAKAQESKEA